MYKQIINDLIEEVKQNNDKVDLETEFQKGRVPTQAFSEFLTNNEQGIWAENIVKKSIENYSTNQKVINYGRAETLIAGDPGFREFYSEYQDELIEIGKCPDLLVFDNDNFPVDLKNNIDSGAKRIDLISDVENSKAGLEVRSSAFLKNKYYEAIEAGNAPQGRKFLSITVKVEDILVVTKWINTHNVPHYYVQVFFDSIFILPFKKILEIISDQNQYRENFTIEKNTKNQLKTTIHINLECSECLSSNVPIPVGKAEKKFLGRGRVLNYVKFEINELPDDFNMELLTKVLSNNF
tara:strand:- start:26 stop:910 length:885 start_codon:yes stop_codon:yes gene_type:complete